jgi:uncharacterized membrane protein YhaH (DUF805 family)
MDSPPFMGSITIIQIVTGLIAVVLVFIPLWKIYRRAGFSPWLLFLWFIPYLGPLLGIIVLYIVAFAKWKVRPEDQKPPASQPSVL